MVLDVDDVILEFVRPFVGFLDTRGLDLKLETFRLNGNIIDRKASIPVETEVVASLIDDFFHVQAQWQTAVEGAVDAIAELSRETEIVMLTAMPHRHRALRRAHLDNRGFPYPLLTTETPKGPAIGKLRGEHQRAVAFVDDIPRNLVSVRDAVADAHLFHLMAMPSLRGLLPPLPDDVAIVDDWRLAGRRIAAAFDL